MHARTIDERLSALERENRRLKACTGALALGLAIPLFVAAASPQASDVVRATRFEVVRDGRVVVQIDSDQDGGQVIVRNAAGLRAGFLQATPKGGSLDISDASGKTVGYFDALKAGGGEVCVYNSDNKCVAFMSSSDRGGFVQITDLNGNKAATLSTSVIGGGNLTIFDSQNRRAAYLKAAGYGGSLDISKYGETVGYFDAVASGTNSVGAKLCVGKTSTGCSFTIPQ